LGKNEFFASNNPPIPPSRRVLAKKRKDKATASVAEIPYGLSKKTRVPSRIPRPAKDTGSIVIILINDRTQPILIKEISVPRDRANR
jgi:hypothetical protein